MGSKDRDANGGRSAIRHSVNGGCWYLAGCQHLYGKGKCGAYCKGKEYDDKITEASKANYAAQIQDSQQWDQAAFDLFGVQTCSEQDATSPSGSRMSVRMPRS